MRATVFTDAALSKHAGRFVWLSIDTEDARNATYLEQHPFEAVPTFQVLDASTARVAYRWIGAVDVKELLKRFDEAETAFRQTDAIDVAVPSAPDAALVELALAGKDEECAQHALALLPGLPNTGAKASVAATGLDCALSSPETASWRNAALATLEGVVRDALAYEGLLDDDRSGLYGVLVDARDRQGDSGRRESRGGEVARLARLAGALGAEPRSARRSRRLSRERVAACASAAAGARGDPGIRA
jgi:hypothetical protein